MQIAVLLVACAALVSTVLAAPHSRTVTLRHRADDDDDDYSDYYEEPEPVKEPLIPRPKTILVAANDLTPQRVDFHPTTKNYTIPTPDEVKKLGYHFKDLWAGDPTEPRYGDWYVVGRLGAGAFGTVILGYNGEQYGALKFIDVIGSPEEEVMEEIKAQWKLRQVRNVVHLYEYGHVDEHIGRLYQFTVFAMEAANAGDLTHFIPTGVGIEPALAKNLFKQLAQGLKECHQKGLALRDIKPDNILLFKDPKGELIAKYADFGLATPLVSNTYDARGTILYLAPEGLAAGGHRARLIDQDRQGKSATYFQKLEKFDIAKLDVYALGVTLVQMLTGKEVPRIVEIPEVGLRDVSSVNFAVPGLQKADPKVLKLLRGMLHDDPKQRYSIDEVLKSEWLA